MGRIEKRISWNKWLYTDGKSTRLVKLIHWNTWLYTHDVLRWKREREERGNKKDVYICFSIRTRDGYLLKRLNNLAEREYRQVYGIHLSPPDSIMNKREKDKC